MVSLLYFFFIKLGQFQTVEAMHQPVASAHFGFAKKNWQCQPVEKKHQPVATGHFGTRIKK